MHAYTARNCQWWIWHEVDGYVSLHASCGLWLSTYVYCTASGGQNWPPQQHPFCCFSREAEKTPLQLAPCWSSNTVPIATDSTSALCCTAQLRAAAADHTDLQSRQVQTRLSRIFSKCMNTYICKINTIWKDQYNYVLYTYVCIRRMWNNEKDDWTQARLGQGCAMKLSWVSESFIMAE